MNQTGCEGNGSKNKKDYHHVWSATSDIKRLVVAPRREGGSGVVSIADCVNGGRLNLTLYDLRSNEVIIAATAELKLKKVIK